MTPELKTPLSISKTPKKELEKTRNPESSPQYHRSLSGFRQPRSSENKQKRLN